MLHSLLGVSTYSLSLTLEDGKVFFFGNRSHGFLLSDDMSYLATENISSSATEDASSVATEDSSSVATEGRALGLEPSLELCASSLCA